MIRRKCVFSTALLLGLSAAVYMGQGAYVHLKARLGQYLIRSAWTETLQTGIPHKPWPWLDTLPVANIRLDRLGVDQIVLDSDSGQALAFGPGMHRRSAPVWLSGPRLISGHRDTHFKFLKRVKPGDVIQFQTVDGEAMHYRVFHRKIVVADNPLTVEAAGDLLVLSTCWPFDNLTKKPTHRYLVVATPV